MNPNIDKRDLQNYLLGTLEADHRATLEESILCDAKVYEELLVIEGELIDRYLANELSPSERQQFDTHFLVTAERQKNLRFGRLLRRYLAETPAPAKKILPFAALPISRGAGLAVSAAVVASIAIIVLACWVSTRKAAQSTVLGDSSELVKVSLTPGSERSEGGATQRVSLPPKAVKVRLELQVANSNFQNYKSELFREKDSLQTSEELKAETNPEKQHIIPWTIAGEVLSPGDYKVRLSGVLNSGQDEFIDSYSFHVTK